MLSEDGTVKGRVSFSAQGQSGQLLRHFARSSETFGKFVQSMVAATVTGARLGEWGRVHREHGDAAH